MPETEGRSVQKLAAGCFVQLIWFNESAGCHLHTTQVVLSELIAQLYILVLSETLRWRICEPWREVVLAVAYI